MQMLAFEKGQEVLGPYQVGGPITKQASVRIGERGIGVPRAILLGPICANVEVTEQIREGEIQLAIAQAVVALSISNRRTLLRGGAHLMPRQLRGPFEKATSQLSSAFDPGWSQRSGRNSCGRGKICSEKWTKSALWLTTVCGGSITSGKRAGGRV